MPHAVGIDIGGTSVKVGLVDESGTLLSRASFPTPPGGAPSQLMDGLARALPKLLAGRPVESVGVSVAGFLDPGREVMSYNANLPELSGFPLREAIAARFSCAVRLEVDSNAAAHAEYRFGAGQGARRLLFLTLGTGVGGGVVVNGELLRFTGECAGDLGHVIVEPGGRRCPCGALGCLEALVSRPTLEELGGRPAYELIEAARRGEAKAVMLFAEAGRWLGLGLASLSHLFQPDRIVIGGGLATAGECLFDASRASFAANASPHFSAGVEVLPARFHGHEGVIGAAGLFF